ncbi:MAG TPA: ABC transporter substrate-binding protein [Stellaceae bacterium]|nr:ABC transporter substrate-binding protein [Stellaceae bacterium]
MSRTTGDTRLSLTRRTILMGAAALATTRVAHAAGITLRVGDQRGGIQPLMAAAGVLRDAPYTVAWSQFAGAPMLLEALNAEAIDTGGVGDAPFASAVASGIPMKAVSATRADGAVTALVVPGASPVRSVSDLKGRTIATLRGQTGHFLVLAALRRDGLSPGDVRFAFIAPSEAKAAMASGAVDAWATWGPYISLAKVEDGAREIVNGHELMSGQSYMLASDQAISGKRAALADFLHRLRLAREWGLAKPEEQAKVWAESTGFSLSVARDVVNTAQTRTVAIDDTVVAAQQRVADFFQGVGVLPRPQHVADSFDRSFNDAVFAA